MLSILFGILTACCFASGSLASSRTVRTIGPGKVWVPTHLFKLVYDPTTNRAWASA